MNKETVWINSGDRKMHGIFITPESTAEKIPAVLLIHGMTSSNSGYVVIGEQLADIGIASLSISLSGHGESEGDFNQLTVSDLTADGYKAMEYLVNQSLIDPERIGVLGTSVGAHIASMISSKYKVKSLVLRVPAIYTARMMELKLPKIMATEGDIFQLSQSDIESTPAIKSISNFSGNLLIMSSENDQVIPANIPNTYVSSAKHAEKVKLVQIKGATHNLSRPQWREEFIRLSINQLCQL